MIFLRIIAAGSLWVRGRQEGEDAEVPSAHGGFSLGWISSSPV